MMSRLSKFAIAMVAVALMGAACSKSSAGTPSGSGSSESSEATGGTITINGVTVTSHGTESAAGKSSFELELDNDSSGFYFQPTVLKGDPGAKLTLTLKNEGNALHNFSLTEQSVDQDVQVDAEETVSVTFPQSGTLEFFCKFHKSQGMLGELSAGS
jgi:plastocyanin